MFNKDLNLLITTTNHTQKIVRTVRVKMYTINKNKYLKLFSKGQNVMSQFPSVSFSLIEMIIYAIANNKKL